MHAMLCAVCTEHLYGLMSMCPLQMHLDARLDAKLLATAVDHTFEYSPVALQLAWHIQGLVYSLGYMHASIWRLLMNQMHPTATELVITPVQRALTH